MQMKLGFVEYYYAALWAPKYEIKNYIHYSFSPELSESTGSFCPDIHKISVGAERLLHQLLWRK